MGDKTRFAVPQLIELGKNVVLTWDDPQISMDIMAMMTFYSQLTNQEKLWQPDAGAPKNKAVCPQILALPPDCVVICATSRCTPVELFVYLT